MGVGGLYAAVYNAYIFAVLIYSQSVNVKAWTSCGVLGCKWGIVHLSVTKSN